MQLNRFYTEELGDTNIQAKSLDLFHSIWDHNQSTQQYHKTCVLGSRLIRYESNLVLTIVQCFV